jgi:hypothetical protein
MNNMSPLECTGKKDKVRVEPMTCGRLHRLMSVVAQEDMLLEMWQLQTVLPDAQHGTSY